MELIKKYWYVTLLLLGTAGLGVTTLLISLQLQQKSSITTQESQAAGRECSLTFTIEDPVPTGKPGACELAFALTIPTNTPTPSPMQPSTTPTPRPTNTPAPGACNYACTSNAQCSNSLICSNGLCRNPDCIEQPNCACYFVPTPKVPVTGMGTTLVGIAVIAGGIILLLLGLVF